MHPAKLRETTMDQGKGSLLRVEIPSAADPEQSGEARHTANFVEALMGRKAEKRFSYIQENAKFVTDIDV